MKRFFFLVLVLSAFVFAEVSTEKLVFQSNGMADIQFSKSLVYDLKDDSLDNKLYFKTPAKEVYLHFYFQGSDEMRRTLTNIVRIDVWPKFESLQFDFSSSDVMLKSKTGGKFRAVFYEKIADVKPEPYIAPPITTPIEPSIPNASETSCSFVYGVKDNGGEIKGFKLASGRESEDFKSVVFGQEDKVDYSYLYPSNEGAVKKANAKKIELLTATKDVASKKVDGNSITYSFSSPVIILVTPTNGKPFVAAVTKITFASKSGVEKAFQFGSADLGNYKLSVETDSIAVKSREKPFSLDLAPNQAVSSLSWDPSGASCYPAFVSGLDKQVWIRNFTFSTSPTYAGSRSGNAAGCQDQVGHCALESDSKFFNFNFASKTNVTLVACSVLAENLELNNAKLGEVEFEAVAIFREQPKVVFAGDQAAGKKVEFQYSLKQGDEKSLGLNSALWHVVYDPSSFDYYYNINKNGGVPSAVPRHDDASYSPKNKYCPTGGKNSFTMLDSGDYLARLWIASGDKKVVLEEKLVRLVNPSESFGQFLIAYRSSSVVQSNFEFNTNYVEARNSPKGILFNNIFWSVFSISPSSSGLAASFLANAKETSTGKSILELVNPPAFGSVGKITLKNVFFTGSKISLAPKDSKGDKFEGVAFTILQPKGVGAPVEACDSSLYAPEKTEKKCLAAAPFCWGAYLGKYRCYPNAALNGFAAVDAYACKGIAIKSSDGSKSEYGTAYLRYSQGKGYCSTNARAQQLEKAGSCKKTSEKISYELSAKGGTQEAHEVQVWDCSALASDSTGATGIPAKVTASGSSTCHEDDEECKQREAGVRPRVRISAKTSAEKVKECASKTLEECKEATVKAICAIVGALCVPAQAAIPPTPSKTWDLPEGKTCADLFKEGDCLKYYQCDWTKDQYGVASCDVKASKSRYSCEAVGGWSCNRASGCLSSTIDKRGAGTCPYGTVCCQPLKTLPSGKTCYSISPSDCIKYSACEVIDASFYGKACVPKAAAKGSLFLPSGKICSDVSKTDCFKYLECTLQYKFGASICVAKAGYWKLRSGQTCSSVSTSECNYYSKCKLVSTVGGTFCQEK